MFEIIVNGRKIQLLQPISEVTSLVINHVQHIPIRVHSGQSKPITEWLYNLTQQVDGLLEYNGVLMDRESINKPVHMKD